MPSVRFSSHLAPAVKGVRELSIPAGSVEEALDAVEELHPGFRFRVVDEQDAIRPHINMFIGQDKIDGIANRPLGERDVLSIFGALSGG